MGSRRRSGNHHNYFVWHNGVSVRYPDRSSRRDLSVEQGQHFRCLRGFPGSQWHVWCAHWIRRRSLGISLDHDGVIGAGDARFPGAQPDAHTLAVVSALVGRHRAGNGAHALSGFLYRRDELVSPSARNGTCSPDTLRRVGLSDLCSTFWPARITPGVADGPDRTRTGPWGNSIAIGWIPLAMLSRGSRSLSRWGALCTCVVLSPSRWRGASAGITASDVLDAYCFPGISDNRGHGDHCQPGRIFDQPGL